MKIVKLFLLCLLILTGCQTPDAREISIRLGRPELKPACIHNGDGTCFIDGELITDTENRLSTDPETFRLMSNYIEQIERRLFICLRNSRRCR